MAKAPNLLSSPSAAVRVERAKAWLASHPTDAELVLVGTTLEGPNDVARAALRERGAGFGWHRTTLGRLAASIAGPMLWHRGLAPVGPLALEAVCARVLHEAGRTGISLGALAAVADRPGLPRAIVRTLSELRLAGVDAGRLDAGLAAEREGGGSAMTHGLGLSSLQRAYEAELERAGLADRALVLMLAAAMARDPDAPNPLLGLPILLLDVPVASVLERELIAALAARSDDVFATVPAGDARSIGYLEHALGTRVARLGPAEGRASGSLARLQECLFEEAAGESAPLGDDVVVLSAPGESRECVEIARIVRREAERGVPFDRMAILLRAPLQYRPHLEEALRRASVPAHFSQGTVRPDPAGRAMLALLACADEGLSARRFAEYLSLGEVPDATGAGEPPLPLPEGDRWVVPDEELVPASIVRAHAPSGAPEEDEEEPIEAATPANADAERAVIDGRLRSPRRWERLLVDAAVIGGRDRWERRLAGFRRELELDLESLPDPDDPVAERIRSDLGALDALQTFALPLLQALSELPRRGTWGGWLDALSSLATRALRHPERVLSALAELAPMRSIGPVDLPEVRLVLEKRLAELVVPATGRKYGRVYIAPLEAARGLAFDVVFVPGLAERLFPQKVIEDPLLRDHERRRITSDLPTSADRVAVERLALRLGIGAAAERLVISYPRLDMEQSRPRVPSFYGLEILRAAEGSLPGFDELARRAEQSAPARIGWPAPARASDAIDEAEYDLALLESLSDRPEPEVAGAAHYLLTANAHLARALRFRARRWIRKWTYADGLVELGPLARKALDAHLLSARSYSPTALQTYATCPYKFFLYAVHKLSPRDEPEAIEQMTPLQRGSLVHTVLFELMVELDAVGLLPVTSTNLEAARSHLEEVVTRVAARVRDDLAPAIERVWDDALASIKADLREALRRSADAPWTPLRFELSFGLKDRRARDAASRDEPVELDAGIRLRGSIDLVERSATGLLRATDYKTGKVRAERGAVVGGGETLQPILYALALEKLFPDSAVESGRLYYSTSAGEFSEVIIPLDDRARSGAALVASTIGGALEQGFLPAAPSAGACEYCDYLGVCGPYEEHRTSRVKRQEELRPLVKLRSQA